jgi:hypothetical protein
MSLGSKAASSVLRAAWRPATQAATRLAETVDKEIVADVFSCAMKKQTGVSLKYMLTFGHVPLERQVSCWWCRVDRRKAASDSKQKRKRGFFNCCRTFVRRPRRPRRPHHLLFFPLFSSNPQPPRPTSPIQQLLLSAQFLHNELPVRLAHRVAELENLPYGLSAKAHVLKVRDWYVSSFSDLRRFPKVKDAHDERAFTDLLRSIYERHKNVVPVMAMGVAELKQELFGKDDEGSGSSSERARRRLSSLDELPEIHSFLDGFYLSRIGIRMLIGQHIALHEPQPASHYIGMVREEFGFRFWGVGGQEKERRRTKNEEGTRN